MLLKIALAEGEAPVGQTIALIGEAGRGGRRAGRSAGRPRRRRARAGGSTDGAPTTAGRGAAATPATHDATARIKASPLARRIARERGIDLATLQGTGPDGRIVAEDVERAQARPAAPPPRRSDAARSSRSR